MNATEKIVWNLPELEIEIGEDGFGIGGTIDDVQAADKIMEEFIPIEYRRGMLSVFYETNYSGMTYRRNA